VILAEGSNCWRIAPAARAAFLIDAAAYFAALRQAMERAEREIIIVGWDVDTRVRLAPSTPEPDGAPAELLPFLKHLLDARPDLHVYVLSWDFSFIYMLERQALPTYHFARNGHPRLTLQLDGRHPLLASQHQKMVTVDGRVAFVGGVDLTIRRWDTPEHRAGEPRRVDPLGRSYPPFHDVQMIVDGEAARAVSQLAAARWEVATGAPPSTRRADAPFIGGGDPWPPEVRPDLRDAAIGIARTQPAYDDRPAANEVLTLTLDALASARRSVYIETQYLTSAAVGQALERSLAAPDGPEIVVVMPREQSGWLEQSSMGVLRARLVGRLQSGDRHGRLRIFYPVVPGLIAEANVNVHAKVLVVDDTLARVGSSNLSNRSMGLDSECDLVVDAGASPEVARGVVGLRDRLLAEHLGTDARTVSATIEQTGSLIAAIERLRGGPRTLEPLVIPPDLPELSSEGLGFNLALMDGFVSDPERPAPDFVAEEIVPPEARQPAIRSVVGWTIAVALVTALVATWRFTPLRELLDVARLAQLGRALAAQPAAPALVLAAYLAGGLLFFPISVLLAATAMVFTPLRALAYALGGALASAALTYGMGRLIARFAPRWLERPAVERVRRALARRGILAVIVMRLLPVGNFSLINMVAGAMRLRLRDFLIGSTVGLLPGTLILTAFANRLVAMLRNPGARSAALLAAVLVVLIILLFGMRRMLGRFARRTQERHG
jgi:phosphatidylserine/phosphatidylglycerophosphate/cardiolipin synthase-like enzyme/uncharacterized membrane protein YdjX (TVP38/TMEM64 family)